MAAATSVSGINSLKTPGQRLGYLDWMRGVAALIMLQGHVFHSLAAKDSREGSAYVLSQFIGGITPAVFLFLTGVTLAFLMDSRTRAGVAPLGRVGTAMRRAGYLAILAVLFRSQLWLFSQGQSPWTDLFKVDILNCMAVSILVLSPLAAVSTLTRARWSFGVGALIAFAAPVISSLDWSGVHPFLSAYIVPDTNYFSFFPWAAFLAFGVSAGSVLRLVKSSEMSRLFPWVAMVGLMIYLAGQYFSDLPYSLYAKSEFWLNSPTLTFIKLGILCLMLSAAYIWNAYAKPTGWSWVRQLGSTSLLVYWVHIELVYGQWLGFWKESLGPVQTAMVAVAVILLMLALSMARTGWKDIPPLATVLRQRLGWDREMSAAPAAGD